MPCQILVSYQSSRPTGDIVVVASDSHQWGRYESLARWLEDDPQNTTDNWPRKFTVIKCLDRSPEDLAYLKSKDFNGAGVYYLVVPPTDTPEYLQLSQTGEFSGVWADIAPYLLERA